MGILDDLKDRLGFGDEEEEFDEELYGDDFEEYADQFDEYAEEDDVRADGVDSTYSAFSPVTVRSASASRQGSLAGTDRRTSGGPQLVSMDDVRNSTRVPESLNRDPLPPRRATSSSRASLGRASDYTRSDAAPAQAPEAAQVQASPRNEGFSSLFSETGSRPASSSYDPYRAYEDGAAPSHRPTRNISVVSPMSYGEVENVARMLRAGDAVVLSLGSTPSQLSKRILDFSFGVASALDATVDCIADKVFAITRSTDLSEDELSRLRAQGVI